MPGKLEELGLVKYLDATKGLHGDNGFDEFEQHIIMDTPINAIADAFAVTRPTVYEWKKLFDKMKTKEIKQK